MERQYSYPFDVTLKEALAIQEEIRKKISFVFPFKEEEVRYLAGVDVSYNAQEAVAVVVVMRWPSLEVVEVVSGNAKPSFPYVPGFLSFREGPAIEQAFARLSIAPHIFFFDGQGIAHPRGVGLASHIGVLFGLVSIGVAKKTLVGEFAEPEKEQNSFTWIEHKGKRVGMALRTKNNTRPIFVSPGHRIDFDTARNWVLRVTGRYRLPEPVRLAHILSERKRRGGKDDQSGSLGF